MYNYLNHVSAVGALHFASVWMCKRDDAEYQNFSFKPHFFSQKKCDTETATHGTDSRSNISQQPSHLSF